MAELKNILVAGVGRINGDLYVSGTTYVDVLKPTIVSASTGYYVSGASKDLGFWDDGLYYKLLYGIGSGNQNRGIYQTTKSGGTGTSGWILLWNNTYTASFPGYRVSASGFIGPLQGSVTGTASYASNALSASRATSASRADSAASATSATSATKLVGSSGSTSVPVYFDAGVPKVVTAINLANITASTGFRGNLTGTASYATSASRAISASRADSAASAESATTATKLVGTSGSTSVPVYFNSGVPTAVSSINLATITASTGFKGNLTGTASYASVVSQVSAAKASPSSDHFIPLFQGESGSQYVFTTASIKYSTNTKTLTVPNITGTASFATSASIAVSASKAVTASYVDSAVEKPNQVQLTTDCIYFYAERGHTYLLTVSSPGEQGYPTDQVLICMDEHEDAKVAKATRLFGGSNNVAGCPVAPSELYAYDDWCAVAYIANLSAGSTYASIIDYYSGKNITFEQVDSEGIEFNAKYSIESFEGQPIVSKEFPPYTCTAANDAKARLAFFEVYPTDSNWIKPWHIHYRLYVTTSTNECQGYYDCYISQQGSNLTYRVWNERYSTSYYPIYTHLIWWHNTQALWNNRATNPIRIGARVYSAYAANTLARTYKIEILEMSGCTMKFLDNIATRDSFHTSAKYAEGALDATTLGVTVTGDRNNNTLPTQLYDSYAGLLVHSGSKLYRYKICGFDASGSLVPTTVTNQTSDTVIAKSASAVPMKVHKGLIYYSSTAAVSGTLRTAANTIYRYQGATSALPLYNFSANPGVNTDIYLKGSYNPYTDEFTLDTSSTTSYYQFIPQGSGSLNSASAFVSGAYYWYVGYKTSNATYANFALEHPLYQYRYDENIGRNALTLVEPITNVPDMNAISGSRGFIKNKVGGYAIPLDVEDKYLSFTSTASIAHWQYEPEKYISVEEFKSYGLTDAEFEAFKVQGYANLDIYCENLDETFNVTAYYNLADYGENWVYLSSNDTEDHDFWLTGSYDYVDFYFQGTEYDYNENLIYPARIPWMYIGPLVVDGVKTTNGIINSFGVCSTVASSANKSTWVNVPTNTNNYIAGTPTITVKFANKNTADNPKLSVGTSNGHVPIYYNGVKITTGSKKSYLYGYVDLRWNTDGEQHWDIVSTPVAAFEDTVGNLETLLAAI